jgi:uncharacterized protein YjbJ (UPF0337 family)
MKSRSKDKVEGRMHQVKVNAQDDIWKIANTHGLEAGDNVNNPAGKVQEKLGKIKINVSSVYETALVARPAAWPLMLIDMK